MLTWGNGLLHTHAKLLTDCDHCNSIYASLSPFVGSSTLKMKRVLCACLLIMQLIALHTARLLSSYDYESHNHNSFFSSPPPPPAVVPLPAPNFMGSPFSFAPFCPLPTMAHTTKSPTSCRTAAHAALHTLILTLPLGALGNASVHSTYHGTHPLGNVKIGVLPCQNCRKNRNPVVRVQRV